MTASPDTLIRPEALGDVPAIADVTDQAFGGPAESLLIERLRAAGAATVSLVAERGPEVVGHILFSPMVIEGPNGDAEALGLAPMAVRPDLQKAGIGSALIRTGLESCRKMDVGRVILLGHPEYYPRFGFQPASTFGIKGDYEVPDEVFMAIELIPGAFDGITGTAHYHKEFGGL